MVLQIYRCQGDQGGEKKRLLDKLTIDCNILTNNCYHGSLICYLAELILNRMIYLIGNYTAIRFITIISSLSPNLIELNQPYLHKNFQLDKDLSLAAIIIDQYYPTLTKGSK